MKTAEKLIGCFEENGVYIERTEADIDLRDYIADSLQFMTIIIAIEEKLEIEIPPELLLYDNLISLNAFCEALDEIASLQHG